MFWPLAEDQHSEKGGEGTFATAHISLSFSLILQSDTAVPRYECFAPSHDCANKSS
jgi:hypothetical protein